MLCLSLVGSELYSASADGIICVCRPLASIRVYLFLSLTILKRFKEVEHVVRMHRLFSSTLVSRSLDGRKAGL